MLPLLNFLLVAAITVVTFRVAIPPAIAFYDLLLKLGYQPLTAILLVGLNLLTGIMAGFGFLGLVSPLIKAFLPDLPLSLYDIPQLAGLALLLVSFQLRRSINHWAS